MALQLARNAAATGPGTPDGVPGSVDRTGRRTGSLWAVAMLVGSVAALVAARPLGDNSFLTHLATGRVILDQGVPTENPFLFTGTAFPVPSWWWSVLLAVTEELAGGTGIRLLTAAVAFAVGAVLVRLARDPDADGGGGLLAVVAPCVLALFSTYVFLNARPHLVGFLLLALAVLVWLEERPAWWLLPIFVVWVNVHGTWLYGVLVLVALGVARAIDDRRIRPDDVWRVVAAVGGTVLGGALYPTAFEIVLLPTRQFGDPVEREALRSYKEWSRVPLDHPLLWMMVGLALLAVWGCLRERRRAMAVVSALLFVMGVSGLRLVPVAAICLVPFAALGLRGVGTLSLPTGRAARVVVAAGLLVLVGAAAYASSGDSYRLDRFPTNAVDFLESRGLVADPEVRVLSHDFVGNYLEWRFGTDANAYVDDRPDAATLVDYVDLQYLEDDWRGAFERAAPDVVLWRSDRPLVGVLRGDAGWESAGDFGEFTVFCRADLAERCS